MKPSPRFSLHVLCAGAARGIVEASTPRFEARSGAIVHARFGAIGALKDALMGGAPCDVFIVTEAMLRALQGNGAIEADTDLPIGRLHTGVAARAGDPLPPVDTVDALRATLLATPALYVPDILKSAVGQHIASMLEQLDVRRALGVRLMVYPDGSAAMDTLATRGVPGAIGSTQASDILATPGLVLAGLLPAPFGLSTSYRAGISVTARDAPLAAAFLELLRSSEGVDIRRRGGFEPPDG